MRTRTRTNTMIALRARRQAWEIASDIAYPHVEVPAEAIAPRTDQPNPRGEDPLTTDWSCVVSPHDPQPLPRWAEWLIAAWLVVFVVTAVLLIAAR